MDMHLDDEPTPDLSRGRKVHDDTRAEAPMGESFAGSQQLGRELLAESREQIAQRLERVGKALRKTSESLASDTETTLSDYTRRVAHQVDELAGRLRGGDARQMLDEASFLARRHPQWVLGGLFLAGVGLARFLRARPVAETVDSGLVSEAARPKGTMHPAGGEIPRRQVTEVDEMEVDLSEASSL